MIKIKALNEEVSASEDECEEPENGLLTSEAQEEHLHSLYCQALKLIDSDKEQAKTEFISLLDNLDQLDEAPGINNVKNLKYLSLKNLGLISPKNLDYFLDALTIDGGDVTLWIETGRRALNEFINLPLARACFEEAAKISSCNWLVVDTLIGLYFVLNDYVNCLELCAKALLKDQHYFKARLIISEILKRSPALLSELPKNLHFLINWKPSCKDLERSQRILLEFNNLKERRKRKFIEDETNQNEKRRRLSLNLDSSVVGSLQTLGTALKNILYELEKEGYPRSTIITVDLETGSDEAPSTDDNISDECSEKDKNVNKSEKRGSFPFEFIDKRRSTRVQRIHNKTSDACELSSDNIYEKVLSMIPNSILNHQVKVKKPEIEAPKFNDAQVENSILSRFMAKQKESKSNGKRIDQLIADFLFGIADQAISIKLPSVFIELYKIHRQTYDLPCPLSCQLDDDVTFEEIKLILTANEMEFQQSEIIFLTQMLPILRNNLTPSDYDQFYVRLLTLRGIKENQVDYLLVANEKIVSNNIKLIQASNQVIYNSSSLKSMINTLNENNLDKLLSEQRHEELIELLASKSDFSEPEENYLCQAIESSQSWHRGIEIISGSKKFTDQLLKLLRTCLKNGSNLTIGGDLVTRLLKLGTEQYSVLAWTCILYIFITELNRGVDEKKIVCLIVTVHQYLGRAGTCTQANGEFLLLALDFAINQCSRTKDDLILQCFACLYNHPPPRPGCTFLQAHPSVSQIPLQWEHVDIIYNYFMPEILPEFDSVKRDSIDSDTEILLSRIVALIPDHLNPEKDAKSISDYLENGTPMTRELTIPKHQVTQHLFYFLADYYFKNQEFLKAKNFYILDLTLNHDRFDSWAACALSITHLIEQYFASGDDIFYRSTDEVIRLVESSFRCYVEALHIEPNNCKIWIEYGNLAYNVASYISRVIKRISMDPTDKKNLIKQKKKMLQRARVCFKSANNVADAEEIWLHYYFLGKIAERNNILQALKYYELSDLHLALSGATYPSKISYHNSTRLSIEALEVHYRIHACVLKYIRRHNGRMPGKTLSQIKIHLLRALRSPFTKQAQVSNSTSDHDYISNEIRLNTVNNQISNDVREVVSDLVTLVDDGVLDGDERRLKPKIMEMCLEAMNRCLQRFPNHYKSLYRLAHHFFSLKDFIAARVVLLGRFTASSGSSSLLKKPENLLDSNNQESSKPEPILGLFSDHKNNNLFNGIWRIPTDDIDRPGSFSTHMFRSTQLLIKISWATSDLYRLLAIAIQLSKTPEVGKKYLRDVDREYLAKDTLRRCFSILKSRIEESQQNRNKLDQIRNDVRKVSERLMKYSIYQKDTMNFMGECEQLLQTVQLSH